MLLGADFQQVQHLDPKNKQAAAEIPRLEKVTLPWTTCPRREGYPAGSGYSLQLVGPNMASSEPCAQRRQEELRDSYKTFNPLTAAREHTGRKPMRRIVVEEVGDSNSEFEEEEEDPRTSPSVEEIPPPTQPSPAAQVPSASPEMLPARDTVAAKPPAPQISPTAPRAAGITAATLGAREKATARTNVVQETRDPEETLAKSPAPRPSPAARAASTAPALPASPATSGAFLGAWRRLGAQRGAYLEVRRVLGRMQGLNGVTGREAESARGARRGTWARGSRALCSHALLFPGPACLGGRVLIPHDSRALSSKILTVTCACSWWRRCCLARSQNGGNWTFCTG